MAWQKSELLAVAVVDGGENRDVGRFDAESFEKLAAADINLKGASAHNTVMLADPDGWRIQSPLGAHLDRTADGKHIPSPQAAGQILALQRTPYPARRTP